MTADVLPVVVELRVLAITLGVAAVPGWALLVAAPAWRGLPALQAWALALSLGVAFWPVLFTGYGYRKGIIGRADLFAISGLACLFPLPAVLLSLLGLELWRRVWIRRQQGNIPALPGLLLGLIVYLLLRLFLPTP